MTKGLQPLLERKKGRSSIQRIVECPLDALRIRVDTRTLAKGAPSGAVVLVIDGFDGVAQPDAPYGRPMFVGYKVRLELPNKPTQQTIDVPDSAAVKKSGPR